MSRYGSTGGGFDSGVPPPRSGEYRDNPFSGGSGYQGEGCGVTEIVDQITNNIFTINNNATTLDRSSKQIGTNKDSVQLRDRIHSTEQSTNTVIKNTALAFREFSNLNKNTDKNQRQSQRLQYERLMADFKDTSERYNSLQKRVAERVRSTKPLPTHSKAPADLINWGDADDEARLVDAEERRQQLQAQEEILEHDVALIQERETRIRQLESDILDVNEIFRDLGTLVHEQGEVIDSIEQNVETAYHHVESGKDELSKASTYQRKARKKKCILLLILLVILAIIAVIIAVSVKK